MSNDVLNGKEEGALVSIGRLIDEHHHTFANIEDKQLRAFWDQLRTAVDRESALILKTIDELKGLRFFVDRYQRGYKWEAAQVEALLNDVDEFVPGGDSFYCLQPVVVKHHPPETASDHSRWELIDGQQRMTTVYMILHYLTGSAHCELDYRTRKKSGIFLREHLGLIEEGQQWSEFVAAYPSYDNIDIYHFFEAYRTIRDWFEGRFERNCQEHSEKECAACFRKVWREKLLKHTKVIWYAAKEHELADAKETKPEDVQKASIEIFMRLNSGKIPLTNAELIKALILHYAAPADDRLRTFRQDAIVREWDQIEHTLQNDAFYRFLCPGTKGKSEESSTRIDLLFNYLFRPYSKADPLYSFNRFYSELKAKAPEQMYDYVKDRWRQLKQCYYRLCEWYEDDELYHSIGFILSSNIKSLDTLLVESDSRKRSDFKQWLKSCIGEQLKKDLGDDNSGYSLEKLAYGENNAAIHKALLLFNVQSHLEQKTRFPFDVYNQLKPWSLEHIHAQNSQELSDDTARESYLADQIELIERVDLPKNDRVLLRKALEDWRSDLSDRVLEEAYRNESNRLFGELAEEDMHCISNLALLSCRDNSSLNDAIFPVKRVRVRELEAEGARFIPLTTQRVFSKYYSDSVSQMHQWGKPDRDAYRQALVTSIKKYLPELI